MEFQKMSKTELEKRMNGKVKNDVKYFGEVIYTNRTPIGFCFSYVEELLEFSKEFERPAAKIILYKIK